ncbi:MAG: hypothetical protein KC766_14395 [Myxococcales bacterium]|nr:hypothetical protein [Myxococcales bacterium]
MENFEVDWQTPNTIRWSWEPLSPRADFVQYKLVLGRTPEELTAATQRALAGESDGLGGAIWTQDDNPELGQYELRLSGDVDQVRTTITDGLEPGVEYRAQLLTYDTAGCVGLSDVAVGRTQASPLLEYVLFDERPVSPGRPRPDGVTEVDSDPSRAFSGDDFLSWPGWPDDGSVASAAYENVGIYDLKTEPSMSYPTLDESSAYVELAVAIEGSPVAAWGEARVLFGAGAGACGDIEASTIKPLALRTGNYQVLQLPLRAFRLGGALLSESTLRERALCEVSVGRTWVVGESVRIDAIRLRW